MSFAGHQFRYASLPPVSLAVNGGKGHVADSDRCYLSDCFLRVGF